MLPRILTMICLISMVNISALYVLIILRRKEIKYAGVILWMHSENYITLLRHLSLAGFIHKMIPEHVLNENKSLVWLAKNSWRIICG